MIDFSAVKVFLSVDMEGISGLVRWMDVSPRGIDFERNRRLMTLDANAAIDGAFASGATEVVVVFDRVADRGVDAVGADHAIRAVVEAGQPAEIDTRTGVASGHVLRVDPSVQNVAVEVHVRLSGELPKGARSDLSVEGTIEVARAENVLHIDRPAYSQADATLGLFVVKREGDSEIGASELLSSWEITRMTFFQISTS
jgi:hypothetical protein